MLWRSILSLQAVGYIVPFIYFILFVRWHFLRLAFYPVAFFPDTGTDKTYLRESILCAYHCLAEFASFGGQPRCLPCFSCNCQLLHTEVRPDRAAVFRRHALSTEFSSVCACFRFAHSIHLLCVCVRVNDVCYVCWMLMFDRCINRTN